MVSAAYDQRNASWDPHTADGSFIRKFHRHFHRLRRYERNGAFHRTLRHAGFSRKDRSVRNKCGKSFHFQLASDEFTVFGEFHHVTYLLLIKPPVVQRFLHTGREEIIQDLLKLSGIDRSSVGRKSNLEPYRHITALGFDLTRRSLQDLLGTPGHTDDAALSRPLRLKGILLYLIPEITDQLILQRYPFMLLVK